MSEWLNNGSYNFFEEAIAYLIIQLTKLKIQMLSWVIPFFWNVARAVLDQLNISGELQQAWSSLDSNALAWLTYLKIPEALNTIISAFTTRFVMSMTGFKVI